IVEKVVHTTFIMDKLLKKLSIISEINQPSNFSSITLVDMIADIRDDFNKVMKDQPVDFVIDCPADLVIYSYPNLIEAILTNLIENALFFSLVKDAANARVEVKANLNDNALELSVYDNGIGVERTMSNKLYDMFFKGSEQSKGYGLVLHIVSRSILALGGKIKLESEPNQYTKFIVNLPLNPRPENESLPIGINKVFALSR